ncbi:phosphatidate cytidylyltransferase, partial [Dermacoccus nishinomiyaensis]
SVLVFIVWGAASNRLAPDTASAALIALYVPALVSFAMMLLHADDGVSRIITFILVTIGSDIGGYVAGVLFGKHPMAPTVSPKKSWEGFAGSWLSCVVIGVLTVTLILHAPFWVGILLGSLVVVAATVGDLCESMIKRDLGIKDMSNLIPGHGGLMDRLDSLVLAAPVTWAVLTAFAS